MSIATQTIHTGFTQVEASVASSVCASTEPHRGLFCVLRYQPFPWQRTSTPCGIVVFPDPPTSDQRTRTHPCRILPFHMSRTYPLPEASMLIDKTAALLAKIPDPGVARIMLIAKNSVFRLMEAAQSIEWSSDTEYACKVAGMVKKLEKQLECAG